MKISEIKKFRDKYADEAEYKVKYKDVIELIDTVINSKHPKLVAMYLLKNAFGNVLREYHDESICIKEFDVPLDDTGWSSGENNIQSEWINTTMFTVKEQEKLFSMAEKYNKEVSEYNKVAKQVSEKVILEIENTIHKANESLIKEQCELRKKYFDTVKEMVML
jgi:hypothetical protein